nr:KilA-N domain-containing protein [Neisseria meningitidis]
MNAISISNVAIRQTENNLYNLNDLHKASGGEKRHELTNWLKLQQTNELIDELSKPENTGLKENQQVIKVVRGGNNRGTYACKELVYAYATWISAKFFLLVIRTFDAVVSGSQPKLAQTTVADRTPLRQAVSALVGKCNIDYSSAYNMVHQRFGVESIEEIAADKLPDAIAYIHALTLHSGLVGELLDKQPAPALPVLDDETVLVFGRLLLHAQDMRLFVNRYLPAFQNLGIDGRGSLWSFVHDTEPTFAAARRFMTAQSVKSDFFARDWDWVQSRILSTARAF